jgi:hypothetical protein
MGRVESKVKWSTAGAYIGFTALMYVLELVAGDPVLVTPLPDVFEPLVLGIVPSLIAFVGGLRAKHTPRPDLPPGDGRTLGTR